eukprot:scaffold81599_cov85-Phaeocystis_antarctica.AAC.1
MQLLGVPLYSIRTKYGSLSIPPNFPWARSRTKRPRRRPCTQPASGLHHAGSGIPRHARPARFDARRGSGIAPAECRP